MIGVRTVVTSLLLAGSAFAQPASGLPQPGPTAELVIALAVGEANCTGSHQQMIARYRPIILDRQADQLRAVGRAMAARYQQAHGDQWRTALDTDMARLRDDLAGQPDLTRFCRQTAIRAREVSGEHPSLVDQFWRPDGLPVLGSVLLGEQSW